MTSSETQISDTPSLGIELPQNPSRWHREGRLPGTGHRTGEIGATTFIIDDEGQTISPGYHSIRYTGDGWFLGTTGTCKERFTLDGKYEAITPTSPMDLTDELGMYLGGTLGLLMLVIFVIVLISVALKLIGVDV